jgi:hypothetical protein
MAGRRNKKEDSSLPVGEALPRGAAPMLAVEYKRNRHQTMRVFESALLFCAH